MEPVEGLDTAATAGFPAFSALRVSGSVEAVGRNGKPGTGWKFGGFTWAIDCEFEGVTAPVCVALALGLYTTRSGQHPQDHQSAK